MSDFTINVPIREADGEDVPRQVHQERHARQDQRPCHEGQRNAHHV